MSYTSDHACRVHVLAVSPHETDHTSLAHIFGHTAWDFDAARSFKEAERKLITSPVPVVLCEERLPDGNWKDVLALADRIADPFFLIVASQHADDRLWAEVLNLGAYDVLAKPFHDREVFRSIGLAWRQWMESRKSKPMSRAADPASGLTITAVA